MMDQIESAVDSKQKSIDTFEDFKATLDTLLYNEKHIKEEKYQTLPQNSINAAY